PELGILATDGSVLFWNQVDTRIDAQIVETVKRIGDIDLVAHGYQPMLETAVLDSLATQFPIGDYSRTLQLVALLAPRALVPSSSGYCVTGEDSWINAYKFPVSRERFARDARTV